MTPEEREQAAKQAQTSASPGTSIDQPVSSKSSEPYSITDLQGTNDGYVRYVTGTVTNNTDSKKSYVQVEINELDKSGAVVGSTLANVNNLEPGQKWKFKAVVLDKEAVRFEVKNVTGF